MSSGDVIRRRVAVCVLAGAVLAAGGCGDSPTDASPLSEGRAARWHDTIAGIRSAAAAADRPTALAALARLSGFVGRDAQAGQLAAADAAALKAGIAQARRHLPRPAIAPVPTAAAAARAATAAPPPVSATPTPARTPTTTTAPLPAAAEEPAAPPASPKDDAQGQKDAAKAQKDAAKAQQQAAKEQRQDAKQPRAKPKPEKVKPKGAKP